MDNFIRTASPADAEAILSIYAHYIQETAITFECELPSLEDFRDRIANTLTQYPYLAAERNGEILGYAYTHLFNGRAANNRAAETTIYLRADACRQGLGRRLYQALEDVSRAQNILNLNAAITVTGGDDPYVTRNSADFHTRMGYHQAALFRQCAYKFGRWYDLLWMEKFIGAHTACPAPFIPFPALNAEVLQKLGIQ